MRALVGAPRLGPRFDRRGRGSLHFEAALMGTRHLARSTAGTAYRDATGVSAAAATRAATPGKANIPIEKPAMTARKNSADASTSPNSRARRLFVRQAMCSDTHTTAETISGTAMATRTASSALASRIV